MGKLELSGVVRCGDPYRCSDEEEYGAVHIGGTDVLEAMDEEDMLSGPVRLRVNEKEFTGMLSIQLGWGYSEYTPMDKDSLTIDQVDLIAELNTFEGQEVTLVCEWDDFDFKVAYDVLR